MLFSSFVFLFCFLPFTLIVYFLLKTEYRNFFLLIMSLLFYAWGEPSFVFVMITSIFINYIVGVLLGKTLERSQADKVKPSISKVILAIGIIGNLALLFYFKCYTFLFVQITDFLKLTDLAQTGWVIKEVLLPIGVSFFYLELLLQKQVFSYVSRRVACNCDKFILQSKSSLLYDFKLRDEKVYATSVNLSRTSKAILKNFNYPEGTYRWSEGEVSSILFLLSNLIGKADITIELNAGVY